MNEKIKDILLNKVLKYLVWIGGVVFIYSGVYWLGWRYALARTITLVVALLLVYYINKKWLIPRFFLPKKNAWYIFLAFATYVTMLFCIMTLDEQYWSLVSDSALKDIIEFYHSMVEEQGQQPTRETLYRPEFAFAFSSIYVLLTLFVSTSLELANIDKKRKEKAKQLNMEKTKAELKFLKSQINPHFLFNALNNIYSMSYMKMDQAPETVAKLSDMLRYMLYDCSNDLVELYKEVDYINNYIDFQNLKTANENKVEFGVEMENPKAKVTPMLFEPLVENAFKYSRIDEYPEGNIWIKLVQKGEYLDFVIQNSVAPDRERESVGGIGLENLKQRLVLSYPEEHKLVYKRQGNDFFVKLSIRMEN
ncbi:hypothetical protein FUAX_20360 [Fulvitalea axinellae]|uniref:Signal transduction histidine kinase internal region domain-containing protein n=1 Tax=Fulvitalea axinellae TaxID=1182444 RepID=A0AAU9D568_9BACT|nr:hypothetical protein FUAX_20360 [Fulvitalea axinellae]